MIEASEKGIRRQGPLLILAVAAAANAGLLYRISNFAGQVGVKTFKLKRLKAANYSGVDTWLYIGTGIPGVANTVRLRLVNNFNADFGEGDLPDMEYALDCTAYVDDAVCELQAEVEEIG